VNLECHKFTSIFRLEQTIVLERAVFKPKKITRASDTVLCSHCILGSSDSRDLLQVTERTGLAVRIHFDLRDVEEFLIDFALTGEGDLAERCVVLAL
jgi:hypothetical protein